MVQGGRWSCWNGSPWSARQCRSQPGSQSLRDHAPCLPVHSLECLWWCRSTLLRWRHEQMICRHRWGQQTR
uniref:Uncharacterized protein n=1 Tax=uncultured marine virus TaxID=186617 RepID=A0A0F7L276_9VIRU|nr:hypothetical protein [uncultured marine virus]